MTCSKISSLDFNPGGWINMSQNAAAPVDRYQQRVFTRMKEMLFPIAFTGKNKRGGVR